MRVIFEHMPNNETSALFRSLNPDDWIWADTQTRLLAIIATAVEDSRYFAAASLNWNDGEMPKEYYPSVYGPKVPEEPKPSAAGAREAAAAIRAEMAN